MLKGTPMRKKRLTQLEQAIKSLDDQIAVLQHARKVLVQEQANTTAARKPKPKPVELETPDLRTFADVPNAG